ncbi:peptide ABC transporter substrate-binding protein [Cobetia marina]
MPPTSPMQCAASLGAGLLLSVLSVSMSASSSAMAAQATSSTSSTSSISPASQDEQILRIANGAEPSSLDPQQTSGTWETRIVRDLFEPLIAYSADGELIPGLAERWESSADGRIWTFHLRAGLEWSDGTPLTAEDAVFALRRLLTPATAAHNATLYYPIVNARAVNTGALPPDQLGVAAPDAQTLTITLSHPSATLAQTLAMSEAAPLPRHVIVANGADWTRPANMVTSGAFVLKEWAPQSHITLTPNARYHGAQNVTLDEVVYLPIEESHAALNRFRAGEVEIAYGVPASHYAWIQDNLAEALHTYPILGEYFYVFNLREGSPVADRRIRRALNLATRREVITERILGMGQIPSWHFVPEALSEHQGARFDFADWSMDRRMAKARELMADAGYGPDHPLELTLRYNTLEDHKKIAVALGAMWKPLGVHVTLTNTEAAVHYRDLALGDFEVGRYGMIATIADAYDFLNAFSSDNTSNAPGLSSPAYDALIEAAAREGDDDARRQQLHDAEQYLLDHDVVLPLYDYVTSSLVTPAISGWAPNALDVHPSRYLHIDTSH